MFFLLPLVGAAVGVAVGALVTHASGEEDRQAAEHYREVANDLTTKLSELEKRNNEYVDKSESQIHDLTRQHAEDEEEKDLLRLAIRLQQSVYRWMCNGDEAPTLDALKNFEGVVALTNQVLSELNEELIQVPVILRQAENDLGFQTAIKPQKPSPNPTDNAAEIPLE